MSSWRDTTSEEAQTDLDGLLNLVLPAAEQTLARYGEMLPFGAGVRADGQLEMLAADPGLGEQPPSAEVLDLLYEGARADESARRAVAFVADVRAQGGDAIRVELEHREGVALVLLIPYKRSRFRKAVALRHISMGAGHPRVWSG